MSTTYCLFDSPVGAHLFHLTDLSLLPSIALPQSQKSLASFPLLSSFISLVSSTASPTAATSSFLDWLSKSLPTQSELHVDTPHILSILNEKNKELTETQKEYIKKIKIKNNEITKYLFRGIFLHFKSFLPENRKKSLELKRRALANRTFREKLRLNLARSDEEIVRQYIFVRDLCAFRRNLRKTLGRMLEEVHKQIKLVSTGVRRGESEIDNQVRLVSGEGGKVWKKFLEWCGGESGKKELEKTKKVKKSPGEGKGRNESVKGGVSWVEALDGLVEFGRALAELRFRGVLESPEHLRNGQQEGLEELQGLNRKDDILIAFKEIKCSNRFQNVDLKFFSVKKLVITFEKYLSLINSELQTCGAKNKTPTEDLQKVSDGLTALAPLVALLKSTDGQLEKIKNLLVPLQTSLASKTTSVVPNMVSLLGSELSAALLVKAGSLARLAMMPSYSVQILGSEKDLFLALKQKRNTPKYGLLSATKKVEGEPGLSNVPDKGVGARVLANKAVLAARMDFYGERNNEKVEEVDKGKYGEELLKGISEIKFRRKGKNK